MALDDYIELTKSLGRKSGVWETFGLPVYENNGVRSTDKSKVVCKLCNVHLKYNGNTTDMQKHIDKHHMSVSSSSCTATSDTDSEAEKVTINASQRRTVSGQLRLTELNSTKYSFDSQRAKTLNRKVEVFIAKDLRPLSIVDNLHFHEFVTAFDPRYSLPTRIHFLR